MFGINSNSGVMRFKKKIGEKGLRDIYLKSIKDIEKINAPKVMESYNKIMSNKKDNILSLVTVIDKVPENKKSEIKETNPEDIYVEKEENKVPENRIKIENGIKYKYCTGCNKWKPIANDFRIVRDSRKNKSYYKNICKSCENDYKKAKRQEEKQDLKNKEINTDE